MGEGEEEEEEGGDRKARPPELIYTGNGDWGTELDRRDDCHRDVLPTLKSSDHTEYIFCLRGHFSVRIYPR